MIDGDVSTVQAVWKVRIEGECERMVGKVWRLEGFVDIGQDLNYPRPRYVKAAGRK